MSDNSLLQLVFPEDLAEFVEMEKGELCANGYAAAYGFRLGPDDDETDGWQNGSAQNVLLSIRYLNVGTDPIQIVFTSDGTAETVTTIVTKTNNGKWKWKHMTTPVSVLFGHALFEQRAGCDFYIQCDSELGVSSLLLKRSADDARAQWRAQWGSSGATDGDDVLDDTLPASKFTTSIQSDNYVAGVSGWKIFRSTGSAEFNDIIARGAIHAATGYIANWEITTNDLRTDTAKIVLSSSPPKITLGAATDYLTGKGAFLGKDTGDNKYKVRIGDPTDAYVAWDDTDWLIRNAGLEVYNGGTQTGNIQKNGSAWFGSSSANKVIQWWTTGATANDVKIGSGTNYLLWDDSAAKLINAGALDVLGTITTYGTIKSDDFVSGETGTGWKIQGNSQAIFRDVRIRGELWTSVFVAGLIEARAGTMLVAYSAGKLDANLTIPAGAVADSNSTGAASGGSTTMSMVIKDPPSTGYLFALDDLLYIKETQGATTATWLRVISRDGQANNQQTYTVSYKNGSTNTTFEKGLALTDFGVSGQGFLEMSADGTDAPWYSVRSHAGAPWTTVTERARLGRLNGITDATFGALSGYGLWTNNAYLSGSINATGGTISGVLSIGASGGFYQGTGSFASPNTGLKIYSSGGIGLWELWGSSSKQVYANSSGQLVAAAGDIVIDANGITGKLGGVTQFILNNQGLELQDNGYLNVNGRTATISVSGASVNVLNLRYLNASNANSGATVGIYTYDGAALAAGDLAGQIEFGGGNGTIETAVGARIRAHTTENWSGTARGSELQFFTTPNTTATAVERLRLGQNGSLYLGDTSDANVTQGLVLNQGANDDGILTFKSSDVAHGMTGLSETDTFAYFAKWSATDGGLNMVGYADAGAVGARLAGAMVTADTARSTAALGAIVLDTYLKNGTTVTALGTNGNLVVIRNSGSAKFIFDAEGDSHEDGTGWTAYDDYDDVAVLDALDASLDRKLRAQTGAFLDQNRALLERLRIVNFNTDTDGRPFINKSRLSMLLVGALRQMSARVTELEARLE